MIRFDGTNGAGYLTILPSSVDFVFFDFSFFFIFLSLPTASRFLFRKAKNLLLDSAGFCLLAPFFGIGKGAPANLRWAFVSSLLGLLNLFESFDAGLNGGLIGLM